MSIPINIKLYNQVKLDADEIYKKPSAFKSGWIVKEYKRRGGLYIGKETDEGLNRWFLEKWKDVGNKEYPVYRPTKRITKDTPLTVNEIDKTNLKEQIKLKQKIKGNKNLPPFKQKI
nr:MAG: hypothetical protein [Lake Baikal virophage 5]